MHISLKVLLFGITSLVTALLVVLLITSARDGRDIGQTASGQMQKLNNEIKNSDIMKYNADNIEGANVRNCIKEYLGDYSASETATIYIYVKTSTSTNTYTNGSIIDDLYDFTNERFIKATALFDGKVIKNDNDVIIGIKFVQK